MTTLVQLKSQHPEWCFTCGKYWLEPNGIHTCHENPICAALISKLQQHEATISDLKADLEREQSALHLKELYRKGLEADLAAAQATIATLRDSLQQQARELEEARLILADVVGDHSAPKDCFATGPITGDAWYDLVRCPACCAVKYLARHSARAQQAEAKEEER